MAAIAFLTYLLWPSTDPQTRAEASRRAAAEQGTARNAAPHAKAPDGSPSDSKRSASSDGAPKAAGGAQQGRINLLAPENGGQLVVATPHWAAAIDGKEYGKEVQRRSGFRVQGRRAGSLRHIYRAHSQHICVQHRQVSIAGGDGLADGTFEPIGTFTTQNVRFHQAPYQQFKFEPVKARYVK